MQLIIRDDMVFSVYPDGSQTQATPKQCADEIERLRADNEGLRTILSECISALDLEWTGNELVERARLFLNSRVVGTNEQGAQGSRDA